MRTISASVSDEVAAAFDEIARTRSGRAKLLRSLIENLVAEAATPSLPPPDKAPSGRKQRVLLYMAPKDAQAIAQEASAMGFNRSAWIVALVRRRLGGRLRFSKDSELVVIQIHSELRRLRAGLLQMVRALEASSSFAPEPLTEEVANLASALGRHMAGLRAAMKGNVDYWEIADE